MKYDKKNHLDWLNKIPEYNTAIWFKLHGTVFDDFIRNDITDRLNTMCFITEHDKLQPTYVDDAISVDGISIPKNETSVALESIGATLFF